MPIDAQGEDCGVLPSRLVVGKPARVRDLAVGGNYLRSAPGLGGTVLGEIPVNAEVLVLDGPRCAGGYQWYQVQYNDLTGWTAEGDSQDYWLEPVSLCPASQMVFQLADIRRQSSISIFSVTKGRC